MANQEHLNILKQGVEVWNKWRKEHPRIQPDLSNLTFHGADLRGINLSQANLHSSSLGGVWLVEANLSDADLIGANLNDAVLTSADLSRAKLFQAELWEADLRDATLISADLGRTDLRRANLSRANLSMARLDWANLCQTRLSEANLTGCSVYGVSVWDTNLEEANQSDLKITYSGASKITVDNLEVAQFIYLLLNNTKIRDVINAIGQKGVLILGRFSQERKPVLDAVREKLRTLNFLPIVFDFERPTERDFTETIMTLAGLSCFIIADITNPKSSPLELQATVPNYMIPFVPLLQEGEQPFAMFQDLKGKYNWVLDLLVYDTPSNLIKGLERAVIKPALEKRDELLATKVQQLRTRHIGEYI